MDTKTINRTIFIKDNLEVLRSFPDSFIDLVYLDPPFNTGRDFGDFKDKWKSIKTDKTAPLIDIIGSINGEADKNYLNFMNLRLLELHRVLKDTGSIYLHCDQTMSHSLKLVMDSVFGKRNFRNEIVWCYKSGGASKKHFSRKHDTLFFYVKGNKYLKNFNIERNEKSYLGKNYKTGNKNIKLYKDNKECCLGPHTLVYPKDWWIDISFLSVVARERVGYPTQKPLKLMERIIKASSNEGDLVLDPFCGSGTTCVASESLNRRWIGIDINPLSLNRLRGRLRLNIMINPPAMPFITKMAHAKHDGR